MNEELMMKRYKNEGRAKQRTDFLIVNEGDHDIYMLEVP